MGDQRWVLAHEYDGVRFPEPVGRSIEVGESLLAGREGDLPLGVEIENFGISREAALITATEHGWQVELRNRNGAMLHPWGQGPTLAGRYNNLTWPRIAVRLVTGSEAGATESRRHWLLLEADMVARAPAGARVPANSTGSTSRPPALTELTPKQLAALKVVFADHLRWPPVLSAEARTLTAAGRKLGITESGVQARLDGPIEHAMALGLSRRVGATNPEYLYVLVRAGHLEPPTFERARYGLD